MTILIAGGGIAGLSFALTCQQIGEAVHVFEAAPEIKPLGVGINLQPNAVRELFQLGLEADLREIGIEAEEWVLNFNGYHEVWSEPRGTKAGYRWPQFSVHRGRLQMRLMAAVTQRMGEQSVTTDAQLTHYESNDNGVTAHFKTSRGQTFSRKGSILVGADGIHSQVRRQMHPDQGDAHWGGAVMWRGVSLVRPPRTNNSFILVGSIAQRFVCYPIAPLDRDGVTQLNWIAELRPRDRAMVDRSDWNRRADPEAFMPAFSDWRFDWLDVPDIVNRADGIWEYPMVDRDPVESWVDGHAVLIGDAAHAMYPVGSNGASQAVVDGRVLGAAIHRHGTNRAALSDYEQQLLKPINELVLRNRGDGPIGILGDIERKVSSGTAPGDALSPEEVAQFMAGYKVAAGFDRDSLNQSPPILAL